MRLFVLVVIFAVGVNTLSAAECPYPTDLEGQLAYLSKYHARAVEKLEILRSKEQEGKLSPDDMGAILRYAKYVDVLAAEIDVIKCDLEIAEVLEARGKASVRARSLESSSFKPAGAFSAFVAKTSSAVLPKEGELKIRIPDISDEDDD